MYILKINYFIRCVANNNIRKILCSSVRLKSSYFKSDSVLKRHLPIYSNEVYKIDKIIKNQHKYFHTTPKKDGLFAVIITPLIRLSAFLFGKIFKKWYTSRTDEEKKIFWQKFHKRKFIYLGILGLYLSSIFIYYISHLKYDSLIDRSQFIMLSDTQKEELAQIVYENHLEQYGSALISKDDPVYTRVLRVVARIINANKDLPHFQNKTWTLAIVDSPTKNAYVLPGGNMFVFSGLLHITENDDQLAIVLAHEMAHTILNHPYEQVSRGIIIDLIMAIPLAVVWALFPDLYALYFTFTGQSIVNIFCNLPYSRSLENEADIVGILLAAKACIDVREAVVFWGLMRTLIELDIEPKQIPWLSTHPDHGDRERRINTFMDEALKIRNLAQCPRISSKDPREAFYGRSRSEMESQLKEKGIIF
ncbi:metalloendopeptidase OMA1, mitochondrial-like [Trichogramma pretiosum]|uniref:metalloendopeptidase OMA1, mitochondrial-like n=1 Tax=Trichogramma pretiosum TaxID=7493 RepID=UPI0006C94FE5|nr:metalloendopeptidase OMA1, mitochondrial-like [Trichogramma pretiosum]